MKRRNYIISCIISHIILIILIVVILLPGRKQTNGYGAFIGSVILIEALYLFKMLRGSNKQAASDIMGAVWGFLLLWETVVTKLDLMHPVLVPSPENVFYALVSQYQVILTGVISSMELLTVGLAIGLVLGIFLGVVCGWVTRLRDFFYPIANVLSPIPPVVYSPYIIAIMPSFRSASAMLIILGIFWPNFLNMIIRVNSIDQNILDTAKVLNVKDFSIIFKILLPYCFPGIINGLKVTVSSAVMMLTMAEMMGATKGMGYYIVNYNTYGNYTNVTAGIIVVGIVVTMLNKIVFLIQKKSIKWR